MRCKRISRSNFAYQRHFHHERASNLHQLHDDPYFFNSISKLAEKVYPKYEQYEIRVGQLFDLNDQAEDLGDKIQQHKHDLKKQENDFYDKLN